jgi:hypothetical protein
MIEVVTVLRALLFLWRPSPFVVVSLFFDVADASISALVRDLSHFSLNCRLVEYFRAVKLLNSFDCDWIEIRLFDAPLARGWLIMCPIERCRSWGSSVHSLLLHLDVHLKSPQVSRWPFRPPSMLFSWHLHTRPCSLDLFSSGRHILIGN